MRVVRRIIEIDEDKCDGCGLCIPNCPEGALQIIDGKARLVGELYCDGLGACVGVCPKGALKVVEREAEEFDEEAAKNRMRKMGLSEEEIQARLHDHVHEHPPMRWKAPAQPQADVGEKSSALTQWPVQLALVNPKAPYFQGSDLLIVADCVPFAYADFHRDFLSGKSIVIGCPKLDDARFYEWKLGEIFKNSDIKSVTVVNMEVPCCFGLNFIAERALKNSGKDIPLKQVIIGIKGDRKS